MSDAFDLSEECEKTIKDLLKDHALFVNPHLSAEGQLDLVLLLMLYLETLEISKPAI